MKDFFKKYKQNIIYGFAGVGVLALIIVLFSIFNVWNLSSSSRGVMMPTSKSFVGDYAESLPAPMMNVGQKGSADFKAPLDATLSLKADRSIIKTGYLSILVNRAEEAVNQISSLADKFGGYVDSSTLSDSPTVVYDDQGKATNKSNKYGNIVIRVPSAKFSDAMSAIKVLAIKVDKETGNATDVTAQFVDMQAELKNLKVEESQYQAIMKQAVKVSDILDVASRLSDVRGRIERLQAQVNLMSKQIDMSTITVDVTSEADISSVGTSWKPLSVAKQAIQNMLASLTDYADGAIVFIVSLPILILSILTWVLWLLAWALGLYIAWRLFKYLKKRFIDSI